MHKKTILYCLSLLLAEVMYSQNACRLSIAGTVLSNLDSSVVKNAEIFIENGHKKARTDANGRFELKNLCPGHTELETDADSFLHRHFNIDLERDTAIILYMEPVGKVISRINIDKENIRPTLIKQQEISIRESGKNLGEQLEIIPGIRSIRSGNAVAKPMLQGLTGMRVPVLINGIRQNGQQWGSDHGPEANATAFDVIELINGAGVLKYSPDAAGGIIELRNERSAHPGETDISSGSGYQSNGNQVNLFSKYLHKPANKPVIYFANISVRKAGNYQTPQYILANTGLSEGMLTGGYMKDKNKKSIRFDGAFYYQESGIYAGSHIGNIEDLLKRISSSEPVQANFTYAINTPRQTVFHGQLRYKFSTDKTYFSTALQRDERKEFDFHRSRTTTFPQLNIGLTSITYQGGKLIKAGKKTGLDLGLQGTWYSNQYGGYYFIPDFKALNQAAYLLAKINSPFLNHLISVRSEYFGSKSQANSGKINIHEQRNFTGTAMAYTGELKLKKGNIKFDLARLFRFPWFNELYTYGVHHGAAAFEQGNKNLKKEITHKVATTLNVRTRKSVLYTQIYLNYFKNFINLTPDSAPVLTVRGAFPSYIYRQFDAIFTGMDLQYSVNIQKNIGIKLTQSLLYARNLNSHTFPAYIPPARSAIEVMYRSGKFDITLNAEHTFHQKQYTGGSDYLPPPAAYTLFNANILFKELLKKQNFQLYLGADNILNKKYRNYLDRFRYFADMPGRNIYIRLVWDFHHHNEKTNEKKQ